MEAVGPSASAGQSGGGPARARAPVGAAPGQCGHGPVEHPLRDLPRHGGPRGWSGSPARGPGTGYDHCGMAAIHDLLGHRGCHPQGAQHDACLRGQAVRPRCGRPGRVDPQARARAHGASVRRQPRRAFRGLGRGAIGRRTIRRHQVRHTPVRFRRCAGETRRFCRASSSCRTLTSRARHPFCGGRAGENGFIGRSRGRCVRRVGSLDRLSAWSSQVSRVRHYALTHACLDPRMLDLRMPGPTPWRKGFRGVDSNHH